MALFCREVTKSCKHKKIKRKNNVFIRLMEASVLSYIIDIQIFFLVRFDTSMSFPHE